MKLDALVFVADTHCGSHYGIMPPRVKMYGGNWLQANTLQEWYWDCWKYDFGVLKRWTKGRRVGLVINGDAIEGEHHRTKEISSPDESDHLRIAVATFEPLRELFDKAWVIEGTECHTKNLEAVLGDKLDCEKRDNGIGSWPELPIAVNGCYGIARHHITTAIRPYTEASGIGIQMNCEVLEAARSKARIPRWFVAGHRHKFGMASDGDMLGVVCPPWQALTRHGRKVVGHARYVKPGMVMLDFNDMESGLPTVRVTKHEPYSSEIIEA